MTADFARAGRATGLTDRRAECGALGRLVDGVRSGDSQALVVRGVHHDEHERVNELLIDFFGPARPAKG